MRVAINALAVSPTRPGGDATYVRELVRNLPSQSEQQDEFIVFIGSDAQALFPPSAQIRYVACPVGGRSTVVRALWEQFALPRWIGKIRPDLVHAPVNVAPLNVHLPTVLTVHEVEPFMPDNGIPLPLLAWWRFVRRLSVQRARRILTVSCSARDDLGRWLGVPEARVTVVPLGVDSTRFTPDGDRVQLDAAYLFWVGRPYPTKNLPRLLDAFATFRGRGRVEHLVLAGPPGWADRQLAARVQRLGLMHVVHRRPAVEADLPAWYRGALAFVYPSLRETYGLPILEAMASGLPVVTSSIPSLRETVGSHGAMFVDPVDTAALAQGLERVLDEGDLREGLRREGLDRASAASWRRTAQATYAAYRSIVPSKPC